MALNWTQVRGDAEDYAAAVQNGVLAMVRVEMRVILNVYFFEPHIAQHVLVHFDRAVISTRLLVQ